MTDTQLLPKKGGTEFTDPEYWKNFFAHRKTPFEWYGDYDALSEVIERYARASDKVLQLGCGNSQLASQMYDNGFRSIHSIDLNANVIHDQEVRNRSRPELTFACTSASVTGVSAASQNVVIDKGTLDALFPPNADDDAKKLVEEMFDEVHRVLAVTGRYLIVTLAQEHIIEFWLEKLRDRFLLRVQKVANSASGFFMPVFVLVATKLMKPMQMPIEFCRAGESKPERVSDGPSLSAAIKAEQELSHFVHLCSKKLDEEVSITVSGKEGNPRYKIYIVDDPSVKEPRSYAVFVVPIGRDGDYIFATEKGRKQLRSQCEKDRLAIVTLYRDVKYNGLEQIKAELNPFALKWAPTKQAKGEQGIAYLSLGEVDVKKTVANGESKMNGKWTVEEVEIRGKDYRRLVFLSSQNLVQSEAALRVGKKGKRVIDLDDLACEHHEAMLLAFSMLPSAPLLTPDRTELRVAVLGLGGGLLAAYVLRHFTKSLVTGIELDESVVKVASSHFSFPISDPRMQVRVMDALDFLSETAQKEESLKYDVLLVDLAGSMHEDGLSCPPAVFLTNQALENMNGSLKADGVLALNLVTRDNDIANRAKASVAEHFPALFNVSAEDDINEILLAPKNAPKSYNPRKIAHSLNKDKKWLANIAANLERVSGHE